MFVRKQVWFWFLGLSVTLPVFACASADRRPVVRGRSGGPAAPPAAPLVPPPPTPLPPPPQAAAVPPAPTTAPQPTGATVLPPTAAVPPVPPAATTPPPPPQADATPPADDGTARLRDLYRLAVERYAAIDGYVVQLCRREQVNGQDKPEELVLFKFRKQPWSVYFKWLGNEGKGREAIYVQGQHDSKIHTLLAAGDMPFTPAGKHISISPDSVFVRSASRHAITEAGVGVLIDNFGRLLDPRAPRGAATLRYLGPVKRPEFELPLEMVEQRIPPGAEPQLPGGGNRFWGFDTVTRMPALIITRDNTNHEVEYYCFTNFQAPVVLTDDEFNPDKLWNQRR